MKKQKPNETLTDFHRALLSMSKDCQFKDVKPEVYRDEMCRESFIAGMSSSTIRQRLLEEKTLKNMKNDTLKNDTRNQR